MRFLFTTTPGFSHTVPLVPLAQAARLAGHQVLFAAGGPALRAATEAGLPGIDIAPGQDVTAPYVRLASTADDNELPVAEVMRRVFGAFGEIGEMLLPGLVRTARAWQADAVLYPPMLGAGLLAARAAGSLAVVHGLGMRHPVFPPAAPALEGQGDQEGQEDRVPALIAAAGLDEEPRHPDVELALGPGSLERINPTSPGDAVPYEVLPMRPCTYNGGGLLPSWALGTPQVPRILLTLGSVPVHNTSQSGLLDQVIRGTEELGVEIVLTAGGTDPRALLGDLPDRVRVADAFLPLSALLPTCSAVVHHGGMSTMFAALTAGVPQVVIPTTKGDALSNARVLEQRGAGTALDPAECTPATAGEAVRRVLKEPGFRTASADVAAELARMPAPDAVAGQLARMAAAHRA